MADLPIIPGTLPSGTCYPSTPQELINLLAKYATVQLDVSGARYVISQTSTPSSTQRDFLWHNPDTGRVLYYNSGIPAWVAKHRLAASGYDRVLWVGTTTQLETYDGGAAGTVSSTGGPMWEVDSVFAQRIPVGVGTLPVSGTAVAVNDTGGADRVSVTLSMANIQHFHGTAWDFYLDDTALMLKRSWTDSVSHTRRGNDLNGSGVISDTSAVNSGILGTSNALTDGNAAPSAFNVDTMPPYVGVYVIRRTAREYYTS